jgi:hypothetical protein
MGIILYSKKFNHSHFLILTISCRSVRLCRLPTTALLLCGHLPISINRVLHAYYGDFEVGHGPLAITPSFLPSLSVRGILSPEYTC